MINMSDEFDAILKRVKKETEERGRKKWQVKGRNEGIAIGEKRNSRKLAKNMLAEGSIPVQTIAKISELPIEEVESIKSSMHV